MFPLLSERTEIHWSFALEASELLDFHIRNQAHIWLRMPAHTPEMSTLEFWKIKQQDQRQEFEEGRGLPFAFTLRNQTKMIGVIHISQIFRKAFQAGYLGYLIDERMQNRGLMTEALQTTLRYVFEVQNLHRIMANYMPDNRASARVLEKLGFEKEGYARQYLRINGVWEDHVLTSLTNPHWRS